MNFIQLNVNHCSAAQDLLLQSVCELKIDIAIICEQYKNLDKGVWLHDLPKRSAIWACGNKAIEEEMRQPEDGFVKAKIGGLFIYSCYISPNIPQCEFKRIIDNLVIDAAYHNPVVIAGDFNAWAQDWGSQRTNERGRILLDAFARLDLVLANKGNVNTFRRAGTGSIVDLTFVSSNLSRHTEWYVSEHYTHSDHQAIIFSIRNGRPVKEPRGKTRYQGWAINKFDSDVFAETFCTQHIVEHEATEMAEKIVSALKTACDSSMPAKRVCNRRKENYWWNSNIAKFRKECLKTRRQYQRHRNRFDFLKRRDDYHLARKNLQNAIR